MLERNEKISNIVSIRKYANKNKLWFEELTKSSFLLSTMFYDCARAILGYVSVIFYSCLQTLQLQNKTPACIFTIADLIIYSNTVYWQVNKTLLHILVHLSSY